MSEKSIVNRLTFVSIIGNTLLVIFKIYAGVEGSSGAMISDAVHSLSDVLTTIAAYMGVKLAQKMPDRKHPYGHDRLECAASMLLGAILMATGVGIGWGGVKQIIAGHYDQIAIPGGIALAAAIVSIVAKESMFQYTRYYAHKINSSAFMADAWHHRSDALSSIGSLIGIGGAMLGVSVMEPLACTAICMCILKVAFDIMRNALDQMLDTACADDYEKDLGDFILEQDGVIRLDMLHTRKFGSMVYIDVEIGVDGSLSLNAAHGIAQSVHNAVEKAHPEIKHIMIHENPAPCE